MSTAGKRQGLLPKLALPWTCLRKENLFQKPRAIMLLRILESGAVEGCSSFQPTQSADLGLLKQPKPFSPKSWTEHASFGFMDLLNIETLSLIVNERADTVFVGIRTVEMGSHPFRWKDRKHTTALL